MTIGDGIIVVGTMLWLQAAAKTAAASMANAAKERIRFMGES
jgi:hypothetical protein